MAEGLSNLGIAQRLVLSELTVETHVRSVFQKLGRARRSPTAGVEAHCCVCRHFVMPEEGLEPPTRGL
jgi:DNA-binding NarL/FixJ family response regulator